MGEAEEVFDVVFPSGDESAKVVHPGEEPLHLPSSLVASQWASVLRLAAPTAIRRNQFDAVLFFEFFIEPIRVVGLVPNEAGGQLVEEASSQDFFDQLAFVRRSTLYRYGERKTVSSGDSDDLRPLAPARGTDAKAPFFALAKVASTKASSNFSLPRSRRCRASRCSVASNLPERTHCWKRRWQVW